MEDLCVCCDGCGASYCFSACERDGIEPTQDGEIYCVDCVDIDDMKQWIKDKTLNIRNTKIAYKNAIIKLNTTIKQ